MKTQLQMAVLAVGLDSSKTRHPCPPPKNNSMKRLVSAALASLCMGTAVSVTAGDLASGGRVVRISNTGNNSAVFSIEVAGGSLNVCGTGWITFPLSAAADADTHKRAYAAALLALTTGMPVRVHNYQSYSCDTASYIEVSAS